MSASVFMIGGTSHVGKSTFAAALGARLGWDVISTDKMGRHPGRPWPKVPAAVAEYYDRMSDDAVVWFLRVHHQNMAAGLIDLACSGRSVVIEGSALRPEVMVSADVLGAALMWAPDEMLTARVRASSGYEMRPPEIQRRIDVFLQRSLTENRALRQEADECGVPVIDVSEAGALDRLAEDWSGRVA